MPEINNPNSEYTSIQTEYAIHDQQARVLENMLKLERYQHEFHLSQKDIQGLDKYYILHWEGTHLISQIHPSQGHNGNRDCITHQDVVYSINFLTPYHAWYLLNNKQAQYALSFRKQVKARQGIVLIKKV